MQQPLIKPVAGGYSARAKDFADLDQAAQIDKEALEFQRKERQEYEERRRKRAEILHAVNSHAELVGVLRQFVQDHIRADVAARHAHAKSFLRAQAALNYEGVACRKFGIEGGFPIKLRLATIKQAESLDLCLLHLHTAKSRAQFAGCPKLTAAIQRALKSAGGAERHMARRLGSFETI
jgi:hypothetical protein